MINPNRIRQTVAKTLVAYFSHRGMTYVSGNIVERNKGNTEVAAEIFQKCVPGSDIFEIRASKPYSFDYKQCCKEAKKELDDNARPELAEDIDVSTYDVIFIGYPNWCAQAPMAVFSFIESHDLTGKTVVPFCTHEGSGIGTTEARIRDACKGANVVPGIGIFGTTVSESEPEIREFVDSLNL